MNSYIAFPPLGVSSFFLFFLIDRDIMTELKSNNNNNKKNYEKWQKEKTSDTITHIEDFLWKKKIREKKGIISIF